MASPRPRPPWRRVMVESAWRKRSKMKGRNSAAMPSPVSVTWICAWPSVRARRISTRPPAEVNLIALESRFHTICCSRPASPESCRAAGSSTTDSSMPFASAPQPHRVGRGVDHRGQVDRGRGEPQAAGDHARGVEDVLDELGLGLGVSLDDLDPAGHGGLVRGARPKDVGPPEDGVERGAQLVRDGGQELVLHPVGALRLGARDVLAGQRLLAVLQLLLQPVVQPRVLDRVGRDARVQVHQAQLALRGPAGEREEQRQDPDDRRPAACRAACCGRTGSRRARPPRDRPRRPGRRPRPRPPPGAAPCRRCHRPRRPEGPGGPRRGSSDRSRPAPRGRGRTDPGRRGTGVPGSCPAPRSRPGALRAGPIPRRGCR